MKRGPMKVSIVKKNINPINPSYLSGQINRVSKHTGILDDIYCSIIILELDETKLCLLSYDLLQFDDYLSLRIRDSVSNELGIDKKNVYTIPSHTHAAPEVLKDGLFGIKTESEVSEGYLEFIEEISMNGVKEANQSLEDCYLEYAECSIEGFYGNRNDKDKPSDKQVRFILFKKDENVVGLLVNLSCHPTILGAQNTLISADLIGAIRKGLEDRYHCPVFMTNGAEGDISNRHYRLSSDQIELKRTSVGILKQIPTNLASIVLDIPSINIQSRKYVFNCHIDVQRIQAAIDLNESRLINNQNIDSLKLLNATNTILYHRLNDNIESELEIEYSIIDLESIIILAIPMELFSSLFLMLKESINTPILIFGLTNTSIGYCVDANSYDDTYEGLTSLFIKGEGERFIEHVTKEISQIKRK
jgi:neutral ceramidase